MAVGALPVGSWQNPSTYNNTLALRQAPLDRASEGDSLVRKIEYKKVTHGPDKGGSNMVSVSLF